MGTLNPEHGGGGVENSEVGYTSEEAKANWEAAKVSFGETIKKIEADFKGLWDKIKEDIGKIQDLIKVIEGKIKNG